jgi:carbon monoxide dehydrogenase subunit G
MMWSCPGKDIQQQDRDLKECEYEVNKSGSAQIFGGWVAAALVELGQGTLVDFQTALKVNDYGQKSA